MDMRDDAPGAERPKPLGTPLHREIGAATERHPSVAAAPDAMRSAMKATVTATAAAMADAADADFDDAAAASSTAPQMVDDATLALGIRADRTVPVALASTALARHVALAARVSTMPAAVAVGYDDPASIARSEAAIGRAMRIRSGEASDAHATEERLTALVLGAMMTSCLRRGERIPDMGDDALMRLVEDACDHSIAGVR